MTNLELDNLTVPQLAKMMDHTLLKSEATADDIAQLCAEAKDLKVASVCVNPYWVGDAAHWLRGSDILVCSVVGFPLGANTTAIKVEEARQAVLDGANEIDVVMNIGARLKSDETTARKEIRALRQITKGKILKVIIETALFENFQIIRACEIAEEAGADFVKTSTGFHPKGGATATHVKLMRQTVGTMTGVKASGGIRDWATARSMIEAGATRLGCSATVDILKQLETDIAARASACV